MKHDPVPQGSEAKRFPVTDFGPLEQYDRTHRLEAKRSGVQRAALKAKDWWEERIARASPHGDPPIYDPHEFSWVAGVEAEWRTIRKEVDAILPRRADMPSFHEIMKEVSTITTDDQWKTFFLFAPGMDASANQAKCPETTRILSKIPGMTTAMFSILSPHKHIPAHRGPYAGVLRYHLGLLVPEPKELCRIRIGNEVVNWEEGKSIVFDDTYNHEVWNDTDGVRVVLFVDFIRPLRGPLNPINKAMVSLGGLAPFLRKARAKQKEWEKRFYKK